MLLNVCRPFSKYLMLIINHSRGLPTPAKLLEGSNLPVYAEYFIKSFIATEIGVIPDFDKRENSKSMFGRDRRKTILFTKPTPTYTN